ncbi:MAG: hypothetical protein PHH61_02075 [Candidatus Nanoarchaeia archaeon]|nr:hypothetical protein [Candidatus Nanoarchaeia archaeon]
MERNLKLKLLRFNMAFDAIIAFVVKYWWAFLIALGVIAFAIFARKGILGARLKSLFSWPPEP